MAAGNLIHSEQVTGVCPSRYPIPYIALRTNFVQIYTTNEHSHSHQITNKKPPTQPNQRISNHTIHIPTSPPHTRTTPHNHNPTTPPSLKTTPPSTPSTHSSSITHPTYHKTASQHRTPPSSIPLPQTPFFRAKLNHALNPRYASTSLHSLCSPSSIPPIRHQTIFCRINNPFL